MATLIHPRVVDQGQFGQVRELPVFCNTRCSNISTVVVVVVEVVVVVGVVVVAAEVVVGGEGG